MKDMDPPLLGHAAKTVLAVKEKRMIESVDGIMFCDGLDEKCGISGESSLTLAPSFSLGYSRHFGVFAIYAYTGRSMGILFCSVTRSTCTKKYTTSPCLLN